jgi:PadR family transcriptional regulator AphA
VTRPTEHHLLLGEWACLGILYPAPAHGFAIAARLKPTGDVGRVWSLSRPLTYRSLDQLTVRGYVQPVGEEPGIAGGNRTILAATRSGRAALRHWVGTPVEHLRDLRSELLLKLVVADLCHIDTSVMLEEQQARITLLAATLTDQVVADPSDVVALWRSEASDAALRFLDRIQHPDRGQQD